MEKYASNLKDDDDPLDTMIKKKFTDILDNLDAEINQDNIAFRNTRTNLQRLLRALELNDDDAEVRRVESEDDPTLASSDVNPDTQPSSSRTA